jgi:ChaB
VAGKETLDAAEAQYGPGERARRVAMASLKHTHEKVGDHWEPEAEKGPSDAQAAASGPAARERPQPTAEGIDANSSKEHWST